MISLRRYTPLLLLLALWSFGAYHGGHTALSAIRDRAATVDLAEPAQPVVAALQEERRLTAVALAGTDVRDRLSGLRRHTDELAAGLRRSAGRLRVTWSRPAAAGDADRLLERVAALPAVRAGADAGSLDRDRAAAAYDAAVDAGLDLGAAVLPRAAADRARAEELLAREDALVSAAPRPGDADRAKLARFVGARRMLSAGDAPPAALVAAEDALLRGEGTVDAAGWRAAADPALSADLAAVAAAVRHEADAAAGPGAWSVALAGLYTGLGLVAVLATHRLRRYTAPPAAADADAAVLVQLAQRSQALLHRQLALLDDLQRRDRDADDLAALFRADHLATQLRRYAERAILLAGAEPGRRWRRPVPIVDVARAAAASVERHAAVMVATVDAAALAGPAVGAVTHLLTELIDNATRAVTGDATVWVTGELGLTTYTILVQDRGPGLGVAELAAAHDALARPYRPPAAGDAPRTGLRLTGRLAREHDIEVDLSAAPRGGIVARARLPLTLIVPTDAGTLEIPMQCDDAECEPERTAP
ncbi:nitrate- and nitrite sensing domain-containing protein [Dactylosporangium sp. NPDC049140]|uniref:nitrate- and nitrite sensing domain-containing protein n=1 Tax=Dactylosporangium sp. NPDC049140 TaxID=3155647 RepID=UPI00340089BC